MGPIVNKRIGWLDSSRGIAFLVVLYSHLDFSNPTILKYLTPFFLTAFFFVSGYLFKTETTFAKVLEQRVRTLFIPFVIYGTLMLALRQFASFKSNVIPFKDAFISMITQDGSDSSFWFIPSLFIFSLFFYWLAKPCKTGKAFLLLAIVLFVANWSAKKFGLPQLNYRMDTMGYACAYMALGKAFKIYEASIAKLMSLKIVVPTFAIYLALTTFDPIRISYTGSPYLIDALVISILGLFLLIFISRYAEKSKFIVFVGSNSLLYFCLHGKAYALVQAVVYKVSSPSLIENPIAFTVTGFLVAIISALLLIIPILAINKWLPFTTGKGFKLWGAR